jgi:hypothetical protein
MKAMGFQKLSNPVFRYTIFSSQKMFQSFKILIPTATTTTENAINNPITKSSFKY